MFFEFSLFLIIFAGIINASFVIPLRYVRKLSTDQVWLCHSIIGLIFIPWIILILFFPAQINNYGLIPFNLLLLIAIGGIIFGLGQICFAYAIEHIGIALSFTINLGLGALFGSLFVIVYHNETLNILTCITIIAVILIMASLVLFYFSSEKIRQTQQFYRRGWILALSAGFASGIQNMVFISVLEKSANYIVITNAFWIWPCFITIAGITMVLGFLYKLRSQNNKLLSWQSIFKIPQNSLYIILMGLFFCSSLVFYSTAISTLTHPKQMIAWPAFMIAIIFTSQIWGLIYKESQIINSTQLYYKYFGLFLLILAIILLSLVT